VARAPYSVVALVRDVREEMCTARKTTCILPCSSPADIRQMTGTLRGLDLKYAMECAAVQSHPICTVEFSRAFPFEVDICWARVQLFLVAL
jgi:hypothetical protein